ncbi:MAG: multi-sensor signal transduction histidine kinase, partial [Verrucomicrobiales bacterium]|nr:multi-sensor signal transduction histidine kinase [Verrucomicrobiales bacterium]
SKIARDITESVRVKRALEAANKELAFQVAEKGKRADELAAIVEERTLANKELAFQVAEKGKRADELAVIVEERTAADVELAFQVAEKGKRADELVLINAELKQSNEALERSNVELAQFAYIASHDLQTPLRNISGFVQLIKLNYADKLDERGRDWIRRAVQSAEQMHTLIRDVLEYSRVDSRARPFELVSLREVFNDAVGLLEASIRDAGGEVTRGELPTVIGDRSQLVQLLQNLIGNGLKYRSEKTPHVHVSAQCGGHEWTISISDNGMGIAPRHYERIFEIFKRLHNQQEYPGTGIGLAVCRRVVNRHAGKIWVESRSDQGSTFNFTIPERMIAKL